MIITPSYNTNRGVISAMIVLTSLVFFTRVGVRFSGKRNVMVPDYILCVAYVLFLAMCIMYLATIRPLYRFWSATLGMTDMYAEYVADLMVMRKIMLVGSYLLWSILWSVKFTFLALYWNLVQQLPTYRRLWWSVTVFVILCFLGCIPAHLASCRKLDFFEAKGCSSPEDTKGQLISLYYSFAADVATDLTVMFLPLLVIRQAQLPRGKKIGVVVLFSIGWICIAVASLRVIKISQEYGPFIPGWLIMWGTIEAAIAVIVGCGPGLYVSAKEAYRSRTAASYGTGHSRGGKDNVTWLPHRSQTHNNWSRMEDEQHEHGTGIHVQSQFELGVVTKVESEEELVIQGNR